MEMPPIQQGKAEALKRQPGQRQLFNAAPHHEVWQFGAGCFELQKHGQGIRPNAKKDALTQTENAAITPTEHNAQCHEGK